MTSAPVEPVAPMTYEETRAGGTHIWIVRGKEQVLPDTTVLSNPEAYPGAQTLKDTKIKTIIRVPLHCDDGEREFLIKIYKCHGIIDKSKYFLRQSKGYREALLARKVSRRGIHTPVPWVVWERRCLGVLSESGIVVEFLTNGLELEKVLLGDRRPTALSFRRQLIRWYGRWARYVHDHGVLQEDFDPNNVVVDRGVDGRLRFYLVDLERMHLYDRIPFKRIIYSLARLNRVGRRVSRTDRLRFLTGYVGAEQGNEGDLRRWIRLIEADERTVLSRDCRRAASKSVTPTDRIGRVRTADYRGFYRKRSVREFNPTEDPVSRLISVLEKDRKDIQSRRIDHIIVPGIEGPVRLEVGYVGSSGLGYWVHRIQRTTPVMMAWKAAHILIKRGVSPCIPVAAIEKRIGGSAFDGFFVWKSVEGDTRGDQLSLWKEVLGQISDVRYKVWFERMVERKSGSETVHVSQGRMR